MIDFKKLRKWSCKTQVEFSEMLGIKQGTYSDIESGKSSASSALIDRAIEQCTPAVLFIKPSPATPTIASAMVLAGQMDVLVCDPDAFAPTLKQGKRVIVITDDKTHYLALIKQALADSGLSHIPTSGIKVNELGSVEPWDDGDTQCHS